MPLPPFANDDNVALHATIMATVADMEQLQADIDDNNARADAMQEHAQHVLQEIDATQAQVSALAARVGSRKQVLAAEAMRADEVEGRLHARRTRFKHLHEERQHVLQLWEAAQAMVTQRDAALASARATAADAARAAAAAAADVHAADHALLQGRRALLRGRLRTEAVQRKVEGLRRALAGGRCSADHAKGVHQSLVAAKQAARTHLEQQRAALQAAQAGVQSWAARVGAAQQAVKDAQRALEAEHARVAQRDERCAALETAVGDAVAAHARARARVASLRAELAAQRGAQAAAEAAVADATRSLQVLHTQQRDMQQRAWVVGEEADQQVVAAYQVDMRLLAKEQRVARAEGWVPPDEGAALQAAVEARERQVEVAALHRDMLRAQVKDLEAAVGAHTRLLGVATQQAAQAEASLGALELDIQSLQRSVETGDDRCATLLVARDMAQLDAAKLAEQLQATRQQLCQLQGAQEAAVVELQTHKADAQQRSVELRTQLHGVRDELHALTTAVNAAQARAQAAAARNTTLQGKIAVAARLQHATGCTPCDEEVVRYHQAHIQATQQQLQSLQDQQQALQDKVTDTQRECDTLESALQQLNAINREATIAVRATPSVAAQLQGLQGALDAVTTTLQAKKNEAREVQRGLQELTSQVDGAEQHMREMQAAVAALQEQQVAAAALQDQCTRRARAETVLRRLVAPVGRRAGSSDVHASVQLLVLRWASRGALDALQNLGEAAPEVDVESMLAQWRAGGRPGEER